MGTNDNHDMYWESKHYYFRYVEKSDRYIVDGTDETELIVTEINSYYSDVLDKLNDAMPDMRNDEDGKKHINKTAILQTKMKYKLTDKYYIFDTQFSQYTFGNSFTI